jgi:hypothetical protein
MSKITLIDQNFVIQKKIDPESNLEFIEVNISVDALCHELKLEIIDGENKITLWEEDARALKQVFERANKVFNQ